MKHNNNNVDPCSGGYRKWLIAGPGKTWVGLSEESHIFFNRLIYLEYGDPYYNTTMTFIVAVSYLKSMTRGSSLHKVT